MTNPANDNCMLVSLNDASDLTSLSRAAINRLRASGAFPREVVLGERRIGFVRAEVVAWIQQRIDARHAA